MKDKITEIFVVVMVGYGYHRFQENLAATTSLETAREIASRESKNRARYSNLQIIEDIKKSSEMDGTGTWHIWIEVFPQNPD